MKSSLRNTFAIVAGAFCLMIWAQAAEAQSGSRSNNALQPQTTYSQRQPSGTIQQTQPPVRETRSRVPARIGFQQFDHRSLDSLLQKYVDQNGDVDYATWQANQQDRSTLVNYLRGMGAVDTSVSSSRQAQMAFWINAYNALTIEGILQLYPTKSIKDHAPDANGHNIWDDFKMPVGGTEYSLNDIEHKVLRKMGDPRIHFAIVCASKSCPQLSQRGYFADSLDQQLAYGAGLFFHTPGKFSYDLQRNQLGLSPIIQWFGEDFGRSDQERLQYLSQFMPADAARLATSGSAQIDYLEYDWGLNVAPMRSVAVGQNTVPVQTLRPAGSATRQSAPIQSAPRQSVQTQNFSSQGSGTRGGVEVYRPTQQLPPCAQSRSTSQTVYGQQGFSQQP